MLHRRGRAAVAFATLLALALTLAPLAARAGDGNGGGSGGGFDWAQFFDYLSCASSIAVAEVPGGLVIAAITCGRVIQKYW